MKYQIVSQIADDGSKIFLFSDGYKQIPLNSIYSPEKEAQRFIKKMGVVKNHLVIIIGVGNGALIDCLVNSHVYKESAHFIFVEPFKEIALSENTLNLIKNEKKLSFYYVDELTSLIFSQYLSAFISLPTSILIHPNYQKIDPSILKKCLQIINDGIKTRKIMNNTELKFAVDWIIEPLLNYPYIDKAINLKDLKNKYAGERAVLIASGPSLKQNMGTIKKIQSSAYTFSVGSALRAVLTNGITPDFVLSIDAGDINYETHFKDLYYDGTLIFETLSNSNIQRNHKGTLVVSRSLNDNISSLTFPDLHTFQFNSPSVAIFTLQVIAYLGFSEVYLIGQDLALVDGRYYADGIREHGGAKSVKNETEVENNRGEMVGTTHALKIFLESFENVIKTFSNIKIYNLSEFGAKIKGTEFIHPNSIKELPERKAIQLERLHTINAGIGLDNIKEVIHKFEQILEQMKKAKKSIERLLKIGSISNDDMKKILKSFRKISKEPLIEKVIMSNLTFMFNKIVNKFEYFEDKAKYSNDDLLALTEELKNFYLLVINYIEDVVSDKRITKLIK